jgi:hypothetical protein
VSTRDLVEFNEAQLWRELRCGRLSPSSFYTTREFLRRRTDREHAGFNPARYSTLLGSGGVRRKP